MTVLNGALVIVGVLIMALGLYSTKLKRRFFISEPLFMLVAGVVTGPTVLRLWTPTALAESPILLEEAARLTLAISLMSTALQLPGGFCGRHRRELAVLLVPGMALMWVLSGLLAWPLSGHLALALLMGALVTPTDPILANSIVSSSTATSRIPAPLRYLLSAESGLNDGLAFPLVMMTVATFATGSQKSWATVLGWQVLGTCGIAAALGTGAGKLVQRHYATSAGDETPLRACSIALATAILGIFRLLDVDGLLGVFVAGIFFTRHLSRELRQSLASVHAVFKRFLELPMMALFGALLPWDQWASAGWPLTVLAIATVLFRRLPGTLLLNRWIPTFKVPGDVWLFGWFGPIGVSAMFYAGLSLRHHAPEIVWIWASQIICWSVVVHGITEMPISRWYAKTLAGTRDRAHTPTADDVHTLAEG